MTAVRCKECSFVSKENNGFCPDCGAMYVEPLDFVDPSLAGKAPVRTDKPAKKKGGGLFASLFGSKNDSTEQEEHSTQNTATHTEKITTLPDNVPREQIQIRCQECEELTQVDKHEGYCPNCGAFFVDPVEYVTAESLAAERAALQDDMERFKEVEKTFEEMNDQEKLKFLEEKIHDIFDDIVKDRHVLNEKANECMQCFTAAGTIKSDSQFEVMASMIKQRYVNLENFDIYNREYQSLLDAFNKKHDTLIAARKELHEFQQKIQETHTAP